MCVCVAPLVRQSACLPVDAGLEFPAPCFFFFFFSFLFLKWTLHALFYPSRLLSIRFSIEYRIIRNACRYWLWEYQISGRLVIQIQRPLANGWWVRGGDMGFHRKFLLMKPKRRWRYENIIVPLSLSGKRPLTLRPRVARCSCLHIWLTQQILAFTHIIFLNVSSYF